MKKQFTVIFTEEGGRLTTEGNNEGFNALEIAGLLSLKLGDIIDQVNKNTEFSRTFKNPDGSVVEIEDKKEEPAKSGIWYVHKDPIECETKITCSVCGNARRNYGRFVTYPVNCPECGSFMTAEVDV